MKSTYPLLFIAAISPVLAGEVSAQAQQTAQGAQDFLSQVINSGNVGASLVIREVKMTGVTTTIEKKFMQGCVPTGTTRQDIPLPVQATVTRIASSGNQCTTTLPGLTLKDRKYSADHSYLCGRYDSASTWQATVPDISPAPVIDWSKANIERGKWVSVPLGTGGDSTPNFHVGTSSNHILVSFPDKNHGTVYLSLGAASDLADRVEYAVKFLQMSCDAAAGTGF